MTLRRLRDFLPRGFTLSMWLRHPDAQEEPTELKRENDCYTNKAAEALGHRGKLKVHFKQEETCSSPREGGA